MTDNNEKVIPNVDSKSKEERNVPDLRFKDYTKDYKKIKFGDSFKLYRGSSPRPIVNYISNDVNDPLWIKIGDMPENSAFVDKIKEHITVEGAKKSRAVFKGDMILSNSMSYGKPYILNVNGFIHDGWFVIRDYQKYYNRDYLMQLLSSPCVQKRYSQIAAGGVVLNISSDLVNSVSVSIPTIDEQGKVSNFLSLIDLRINTQKKIINNLESLINTIKNKIFNNEVCISKTPLKDILIEINRKSTVNNQFPVISSTVKGLVLQSEYFDKEIASENNIGYKIISKDNIILSPQNLWMGNITYNDKFENGIVSPSYKIFNISEKYNGKYIFEMLTTKKAFYYYKTVSEQGASVVRRNLNYEAFMELMFNVPPKETQNHDIKILESYNDKLTNEKKILLAYEKQKQYLLNHMFI